MNFDTIKRLRECYEIAFYSPDTSTKNGALILNASGSPISFGQNNFPPRCDVTPERLTRPLKYQWTEHAERQAIFGAAKYGFACNGLTMVCCWDACTDCARAIALSGLSRLVRHKLPIHESRPDWNASIVVADEILRESGVEIVEITELVGAKMFFDGKWVEV